MQHWKLKSESDTEKVYAQVDGGKETGRYRYVMADGSTREVGADGLHGRSRKARNPRTAWKVAAVSLAPLAVAGDLVWHALR